jgi:hypothetical protein
MAKNTIEILEYDFIEGALHVMFSLNNEYETSSLLKTIFLFLLKLFKNNEYKFILFLFY